MKTVGFIGTGGMGSGMAANLIKAGYRLIVNDLRREQARRLEGQGAQFMDSPKAVAESCELVLSMLPNNDAVRAVGLGKGGLAEATTGAKTWIDFSSIDKETIVGAASELTKKGWTVVDAGAGGVEEVAAAGNLALWISGSKDVFDEHQLIFKAMGKAILHVGELGNGKLVKNAMAMLAAVQHMTVVEIGSWLKKSGLDQPTFKTILAGFGGAPAHDGDHRERQVQAAQVLDAKGRGVRARYGAQHGGPDAVCRPRLPDVCYSTGDGSGRL
jgi:3-hydroxyisobutyrate dehydrogenase-like beta-hydroxyacid dehydrogenase